MKPKSYFETLYSCAFRLVYPALISWGLVLYLFLMPGAELRAVVLCTLFCSGVTIIVFSPLMAHFMKHVTVSFPYSDKKQSFEKLKGVIGDRGYRLAADTADYAVFQAGRFDLRGQVYAVFGEGGQAQITGPSLIVKDVVKKLGMTQGAA